jgi:hypothetical protein
MQDVGRVEADAVMKDGADTGAGPEYAIQVKRFLLPVVDRAPGRERLSGGVEGE